MKAIILSLTIFTIGQFSFAQEHCPCCSVYHQQFDFWIGHWNVYDTLGNKVGENLIEKLEGGCIISENWQGAKGGSGKSYNYFNRSDSTWNQVWISSNGGNLVLKGQAADGQMQLVGELQKGQKVPLYADRITWTLNEDGSVTQLWEIIDDKGQVLNIAFKGIYRKRPDSED